MKRAYVCVEGVWKLTPWADSALEPVDTGPESFREWDHLSPPVQDYLRRRLPLIPQIDEQEAALHDEIRSRAKPGEKEAAVAAYVLDRERLAIFDALPLEGFQPQLPRLL